MNNQPTHPPKRYELGRSNELFSQNSYADAQSNFTAAFALAWKAIAAGCAGGDSCSTVPRDQWGDPKHADVVMWQDTVHSNCGGSSGDGDADAGGGGVGTSAARFSKAVVVAVLANVTVRGNDGIITASGGRVFMPAFGVQIPLHRNLEVGA